MDGTSSPYFQSGGSVVSGPEMREILDDVFDMPRSLVASSDGAKVMFASMFDI